MATSTVPNTETFSVSAPSDREIQLTRLFDAPRHLVFEAMTRPEHVREWWGRLGEGYSVPVCEIDLRPGGRWRFVNRTPDGEYGFHGVYREITPPERLVFTEIFEAFPDAESVVTTVYSGEGRGTRLTATILYPSREIRDMVMGSGMERGAGISYDALELLLARIGLDRRRP